MYSVLKVAGHSLVLLVAVSLSTQAAEIRDNEAATHIGEKATVKRVVANVYTSRNSNTFINFGRPYPNQTFTAVVFRNRAHLFQNLHILEECTVDVTGRI